MGMKKFFPILALLLVFGATVTTGSVFAAESGTGHYVPGAIADFGDMAPPEGFAAMSWFVNYNGSLSGDGRLPIGENLAFNVNATSNAEMFALAYTSPWGILDGKFSAGVIVPYVWMNVTGTVVGSGAVPKAITRTDKVDGIGDVILIPFWLGWNSGDFKWATQLNIYAPTGDFDGGRLANVGLNYWTFGPMASFSYLNKKVGLEISGTAGFDFNTNNSTIDYHSGDMFHIEATIAEHVPLFGYGIIGLGANVFYWKQYTADSGSRALLGSFETLMTGVGPGTILRIP